MLETMLTLEDSVRLVACPVVLEYVRTQIFKFRIEDRGCDFIFDPMTSGLVVRLRFCVEQGGSPLVAPFGNNFPSSQDISLDVGRILTDYQLGVVYQIVNPVGDGFSVINLVSSVVLTLTRAQAVTLATTVQ
jgi:hypothetical protein